MEEDLEWPVLLSKMLEKNPSLSSELVEKERSLEGAGVDLYSILGLPLSSSLSVEVSQLVPYKYETELLRLKDAIPSVILSMSTSLSPFLPASELCVKVAAVSSGKIGAWCTRHGMGA